MTVNEDMHSPLIPNVLLTLAGGLEYIKLKKASKRPARSQAATLRSILKYGKDTAFGADHKFSYILEAGDDAELFRRYRECIPIMEYEDYRPYVNRMKDGEGDVLFKGHPALYATTSGATGEPKWIPISPKYLNGVYGKLNKVWLFNFIMNRPDVYRGYIVSVTPENYNAAFLYDVIEVSEYEAFLASGKTGRDFAQMVVDKRSTGSGRIGCFKECARFL